MIAMNPTMESVERDANGNIKDIMIRSFEKTEADGLRSRVIGEMCQNFAKLYDNIDDEFANANLPLRKYESIQDRIASMNQCTEMIGELEIIATCRTLRRIIEIVVDDAVIRYGDAMSYQADIY